MPTGRVLNTPFWTDPKVHPTARLTNKSRYGNDGTFNGSGLTSWTWDTAFGCWVMAMNGSDDYVGIPNSDSLNISGAAITLSVWLRWDVDPTTGSDWASIITKGGDDDWGIQHNQANSHFEVSVKTGNGRYTLTSNATPKQGTLYNVVNVYDGSNQKLYVNGSLDNSQSCSGDIDVTTNDVYIGKHSSGRFFQGSVLAAKIWHYALSGRGIVDRYYSDLRSLGR